MLVREVMSDDVITVRPEDPVAMAARLLSRHNIGSMPVCSADGRIKGVFTDRDIVLRCVAEGKNPASTPVREIMSDAVVTIGPVDDLIQASKIMAKEQVRRLPVTQDGRIVGILSLGDVAKTSGYDMEASDALAEISLNIRRMKK